MKQNTVAANKRCA